MKWSGIPLGAVLKIMNVKEGQHSLEEEPRKESPVEAHNEGTVVHFKQGSKQLTDSHNDDVCHL